MLDGLDDLPEDVDTPKDALEHLQQRHESLEDRLDELKEPRSVSPEEEQEIQKIKKKKLQLKDKMSTLREEI